MAITKSKTRATLPILNLKHLFYILFLSYLLFIPAFAQQAPLQKITLILDWFINPDHAPIIIAEEKGFFKDQGLEINLISPADSSDPPKWLAAQKADIALSYQPQFIDQIEQGLPLISFASLVDKPLNCLLTLDDTKIKSITDLKNKRIGSNTGGISAIMLKIMLQKYGLTLKDVYMINVRHNAMQALLAGQVDALTGVMRNIEIPQLQLSGHKPRAFFPEMHGIPSYHELIFLTRKDALKNPRFHQTLAHFLKALQKAVPYLKQHPQECWQIFVKKYPALNNELNYRAWYASLPYFSYPVNIQNQEEWRAFIQFMRQNDLIKSNYPISQYVTEIRL